MVASSQAAAVMSQSRMGFFWDISVWWWYDGGELNQSGPHNRPHVPATPNDPQNRLFIFRLFLQHKEHPDFWCGIVSVTKLIVFVFFAEKKSWNLDTFFKIRQTHIFFRLDELLIKYIWKTWGNKGNILFWHCSVQKIPEPSSSRPRLGWACGPGSNTGVLLCSPASFRPPSTV